MSQSDSRSISFRISEQLKNEIEQAACLEHLPQTAYIVSAINDRLLKTYASQQAIKNARRHLHDDQTVK